MGDAEQRENAASALVNQPVAQELEAQTEQVARGILIEANIRIYALLFWFALLGPIAAILYRLLDLYLRQPLWAEELNGWRAQLKELLGWLEWIPVRLTMFAFMLSGSFEEGLNTFRRHVPAPGEFYDQNHDALATVGWHCLTHEAIEDPVFRGKDQVRKARGLALRALVVWVLFALLLSVLDLS
jgi:membrane protein required for beta-lactamase induction